MRFMKLSLALMLMTAATVVAADDLFCVDIVSRPDNVLLGIAQPMVGPRGVVDGWFTTSVFADVHYLGNDPLPIVFGSHPGYWSSLFGISAEVVDETGTLLDRCEPSSFANDVVLGAPHLQPGWSESRDIPVCVPGPGVYEVRVVVQESDDVFINHVGKVLNLWTGRIVSDAVTIRITEPEGMDKEAYEAFKQDPLGNTERYGELLRRFPTSTYAAYIVWAKESMHPKKFNKDQVVEYLVSPRLTMRVPCDLDQRCNKGWMELRGDEFLEWRGRWLQLALQNHPKIFFADDMRFTLACDAYTLGDKTAFASGLEELSQHGRSNVRKMAADLLDTMRAKGNLEEPEN